MEHVVPTGRDWRALPSNWGEREKRESSRAGCCAWSTWTPALHESPRTVPTKPLCSVPGFTGREPMWSWEGVPVHRGLEALSLTIIFRDFYYFIFRGF